jgi:hypothetical protein
MGQKTRTSSSNTNHTQNRRITGTKIRSSEFWERKTHISIIKIMKSKSSVSYISAIGYISK